MRGFRKRASVILLPLFDLTKKWLDRYFAGQKPDLFELPLAPIGGEFRQEVWKILCEIPYGEVITAEKLQMIEAAEQILLDLGFAEMRVRCHGKLARIEVAESVIEKIAQPQLRRKIVEAFRKAGFLYVSLDLEGFRSGSMNDTLTDK